MIVSSGYRKNGFDVHTALKLSASAGEIEQ